ncbi:MAG: cobyrinate a,c-diamide synthase [Candidatus Electrothrix aestuarii]|uniref:Cobyrinate a,c-diamide synthase n=1 Tax=Candidatus Electrothrix aestuarii TaxID=3062594 RepID=A0AAU8LXW9_9BACT|nr:cobyrinate a,c-diamide synthase [Candidatus Electrothrix aestuarii]
MMNSRNALIIAGTHSGCGKTTLALGIMAALKERGMHVQPFKCGPDFIDPTLHHLMTNQVSRNLDVRMCGEEYVRRLFYTHAPSTMPKPPGAISIIEGVMGLFDGGQGSAATLSRTLNVPVVLVVDVRSAAESVAAVVKGFETLDPQVQVAGVIFNRVGSERHIQMIRDTVRQYCRAEIIGFLPRESEITLPSRHLGLHMGTEVELNRQGLVALIEEALDVDLLLKISQQCQKENPPQAEYEPFSRPSCPASVRLGVARDEAFCFYYQDNLDILEREGAELVRFSPLHDASLPDGLDGLYLGGGYPELHAEILSGNTSMRSAVQEFSCSGKPVYAECGGFMYLTEAIISSDEKEYPLVGVYPVIARMQKVLRRLGYRQVEMQADTIIGHAGCHCYGHEFHYSTIGAMPKEIQRGYVLDDGRVEGYLQGNTLAGYVHLHWGRTPEAARHFVRIMQRMKGLQE